VALALLTLAIFSPVIGFEFINLDDPVYVTKDFHIQRGLTLANVKEAFTQTHACFWHPLTTLTHMMDCQFYALKPGGHHLTSLLLHMASVVLLLLVLHRMTRALWRSAMVAALFALHPLHVESVAWVAERKDVLSTFFWLLTMWAYVRYVEELRGPVGKKGNETRKPLNRFYFVTLALFVIGLIAKPMLVTLPCVMLLLDVWPLKRVTGGEWRGTSAQLRPCIVEKIPFFILAVIFMFIAVEAQKHGNAIMTSDRIPYPVRFENAAISYATYLAKTFWPAGLAVFYPYPPGFAPLAVGLATVLLVGITVFVCVFRRFPFLAVGWFWFVGTLVPVIGIVQVGSHAMADRYTYVPHMGLFIALVWGVCELAARWPSRKVVLGSLAVAALAGCAIVTSIQLSYWKDSGKLFDHALAVTQRNAVAHVQRAGYAIMHGDLQTADFHARKTLEMFPQSRIGHRIMGLVFETQQNWPEAANHFSQTLASTPTDVEAVYGMGNAMFHLGKNEEAIGYFTKAIELRPEDAFAHNNLGNVLGAEGRLNEAAAQYSEALRLKPDYIDARYNLALDFVRQEKFADAVPQFEWLLQKSPADGDTHYLLALCLSRTGQTASAIQHCQEALRLASDKPVAASVMAELAGIYCSHPDASFRNEAEGLRLAQMASERTENQEPSILIVLAEALGAAGRFDEAIATGERAKGLAAANGKNLVAETAEKELAFYRRHQPYRTEETAKSGH
jgi:tetratricopeptide (TPR) repeat protein